MTDDDFSRHYGFGDDSIRDRQFPVGLFSTTVPTKQSAIFPGGKGAIDLVCLDDGTLWLFELKAKDNISVGTLTELMFYTSMVRDAIRGRFEFDEAIAKGAQVGPKQLSGVKKVIGVMLGHRLHPLLEDIGLIDLLNTAAGHHWNGLGPGPDLSFRAGRIVSDHPLEIRDLT